MKNINFYISIIFVVIIIFLIYMIIKLNIKRETFNSSQNYDLKHLGELGLVGHVDKYKVKDPITNYYKGQGNGYVIKENQHSLRKSKIIIDPCDLRYQNEIDGIFEFDDKSKEINNTQKKYNLEINHSHVDPFNKAWFKQ